MSLNTFKVSTNLEKHNNSFYFTPLLSYILRIKLKNKFFPSLPLVHDIS